MDAQNQNWDDLRFFLAVSRAGTLSGAARSLGVTYSTVFRRLGAFEERLGVRLFERLPDGYALTGASCRFNCWNRFRSWPQAASISTPRE